MSKLIDTNKKNISSLFSHMTYYSFV